MLKNIACSGKKNSVGLTICVFLAEANPGSHCCINSRKRESHPV
jgi:hypothetical protein